MLKEISYLHSIWRQAGFWSLSETPSGAGVRKKAVLLLEFIPSLFFLSVCEKL